MAVTAQQVKQLRDITNAGMMDCKKALEAADGNIDEALKILKEKGLADAKKRSDRENNEGGIYIAQASGNVAIAMIACETDFVANNENFKTACNDLVKKVVSVGSEKIEDFSTDLVTVAQITKENITMKKLRCIKLASDQYASTYIHGNNKIGVVAVYKVSDTAVTAKDLFKEMANNVALHITASAPLYLTQNDVPESDVAEQRALFEKQMEDTDKPKNILENILNGKVSKYKSEVSLLDQKYIKDDKLSVQKYVEATAKTLGCQITISEFVRFNIGE